jgi:hypothetical protein
MQFPPADVVAAEVLFYRLSGMADRLTHAISPWGLAATVEQSPQTLTQYVKVLLPAGGSVFLLSHKRGAWIIGDSSLDSRTPDGPTAWPLDTAESDLLETVKAMLRAHIEGEPLQSPWKWGRTDCG